LGLHPTSVEQHGSRRIDVADIEGGRTLIHKRKKDLVEKKPAPEEYPVCTEDPSNFEKVVLGLQLGEVGEHGECMDKSELVIAHRESVHGWLFSRGIEPRVIDVVVKKLEPLGGRRKVALCPIDHALVKVDAYIAGRRHLLKDQLSRHSSTPAAKIEEALVLLGWHVQIDQPSFRVIELPGIGRTHKFPHLQRWHGKIYVGTPAGGHMAKSSYL
jgi:hypothetical protein